MTEEQPIPLPEYDNSLKYAGFQHRMMAAMVDLSIVAVLMAWVAPYIISGPDSAINIHDVITARETGKMSPELASHFTAVMLNNIVQGMIYAAINILCWIKWGTTPGKAISGLRIVDAETGGRPRNMQFVTRGAFYFLSLIPFMLGFFWIIFNRRKQAWHDKVAGTVVIVDWNPYRKAAKSVWNAVKIRFK